MFFLKTVKSIMAGYSHLAEKDGQPEDGYPQEWVSVKELERLGFHAGLPYYLCVEFGNGSHLPLPIILNPVGHGIQGLLVRVAIALNLGGMRRAVEGAVEYTTAFQKELEKEGDKVSFQGALYRGS